MLKHEVLAALYVSLGFAAIFGLAELWRAALKPPVEWTRKAVHVCGGLLVCAFPWIFSSPWTVLALCLSFGALLLLARLSKLLPSVQAVERRSVGDLLFPVSACALFYLARDQKAFYLAPMLMLVVSDACAALVGKAYGRNSFLVDAGEHKSIEGSIAFLLSAFLAVQLPLLFMTNLDKGVITLVALQLAFIAMCFEALSLNGMDNLILPLGGYYILLQVSRSDLSWMLVQIQVQALLLVFSLLLAWRYKFLTFSGLLGGQLFLYGAFAYGGPSWLLAPVLLALAYSALRPNSGLASTARLQVLALFYATLVPLILLLLRNFIWNFPPGWATAGFSEAIFPVYNGVHAGLALGSLLLMRGRRPSWLKVPLYALASALASTVPALLLCDWQSALALPGILCAGLIPVFTAALLPLWPDRSAQPWRVRLLCAATALAAGLGLWSGR